MFDKKTTILSVCTVTAVAGAAYVYIKFRNKKSFFDIQNPLRNQIIREISRKDECDAFVEEIKTRCSEYRVLGFDCEWTTVAGHRQPVALLQLATPDGLCGLIRLNILKYVPENLKEILEDDSIYKVGVAPIDDAKYLLQDYSLELASSLDLRHLVNIAGYKPGGLSSLAKTFLNVNLDKSWRIRCSDWESPALNERQKIYAATDAHAAVEIFRRVTNRLLGYGLFSVLKKSDVKSDWLRVTDICEQFLNFHFSMKGNIRQSKSQHQLLSKPNGKLSPSKRYANSTRSKPLYHNCFMEAPDGELLCTCDNKKALWYVDKGLANLVNEDPLTVRLKFEPAGRSVGEVGQYYQLKKENKCVVCGMASSYIRKNVVPREYRKYFPEVMKDHSSHDVVLLCVRCHQQSNMRDQQLRTKLGQMCKAPVVDREHPKYVEDVEAKKIRSAARALLSKKHQIPEVRRAELVAIINNHYGADQDLTDELLEEASNTEVLIADEEHEGHGHKVVEYFSRHAGGLLGLEVLWRQHFLDVMKPKYMPTLWSVNHNKERIADEEHEGHGHKVVEYFSRHAGGLLGLEVLWRQHFLDVMKPKYMPTLWSVNHNKERLEIRMREGRINNKDCEIAGLQVV